MKKTVAIIGFGRFGKVLQRLLGDDFTITIYNHHDPEKQLSAAYQSQVIFFCVPISQFEPVIKKHRKYFRPDQLLIDVLSIKTHPKKVFIKYLRGTKTQALLTHPMFGPDSSKNGFTGLPLIMDKFRTSSENYTFWKNFFTNRGLRVVEMSAEEHDKLAARSQGVTHFIARLLEKYHLQPTPIDSLATKKLHELTDLICHDTWQLFLDLQNYNPYTKAMRLRLGSAYDRLYNQLLPERINKKYLVFGIQGGKGSFNEQALDHYLQTNNISRYKIRYLYTSEKVLRELHAGNIDFGLFALHNSVGGVVGESILAMAKYKFKIVEEFTIPIQHYLMKLPMTSDKSLVTIMAHPQAFTQCQTTLKTRYGKYKLVSGEGDLIDTAKAAQALVQDRLPKNTAILGPKRLAELYGLDIIAANLQDDPTNNTAFLLVQR